MAFFGFLRSPESFPSHWSLGRAQQNLFIPRGCLGAQNAGQFVDGLFAPGKWVQQFKTPCECLGAGNANQFVDGLFCVRQTGLGAKKLPAIVARVPPGIVLGQVVFLFFI